MVAVASCMLSAGQLSAQAPSQGAVPPDKGSLSGSGKFQPTEPGQLSFSPSPDPAARLAELGVKFDEDRMIICLVELGRKKRTVTIPAKIHAVQGVVECLLVHSKGSPQDSISGHLESGAWTYCGSIIDAAGFAAAREGSIISVINDPAALVNNAGTDRDNDAIHVPDASLLPPQGAPVKVTLRGPPEKKP